MLIGIDVGGTFTDAVAVKNGRVLAWYKSKTNPEDLLGSLLGALDGVLRETGGERPERVTFSTTLVTNLIVEKKYEPAALVLIPGPGLNPDDYPFGEGVWVVDGAIDYRGREIVPLNREQVRQAARQIKEAGYQKVAVVGKFSQRNNAHENQALEVIASVYPEAEIFLGHEVSGQLNFPRRAATTRYTAATASRVRDFCRAVQAALRERKIDAPAFVLKADGSSLPLEVVEKWPLETVYSGPAASALGVLAMTPPGETTVVIDIGGTTTDLALILSGVPLLSSRGAVVEGINTSVRSLAVRSLPLGGDSPLLVREGRVELGQQRQGPARAAGGPVPTLTDALNVLGLARFGDVEASRTALEDMARLSGQGRGEDLARQAVERAVATVKRGVDAMFLAWEQEPAYRVWEVMQPRRERPRNVAGVGGGSLGMAEAVAQALGCRALTVPYAPVANAVGAAVAKPTVTVTLRLDTERGIFSVLEEGYQGTLSRSGRFGEEDALNLAREWLERRRQRLGVDDAGEEEITEKEVFNVVRGWVTTGRIYQITLQSGRGILTRVIGGEVNG